MVARFAATYHVVKWDGDGEGKLTLKVPASEAAELAKVLLFSGKVFRVIIVDMPKGGQTHDRSIENSGIPD